MAKDAVALRDFRVGENPARYFYEGDVIRDMADNQFADFKSIELVRPATAEDLAEPAPTEAAPAAPAPVAAEAPAEPAAAQD